MEQSFESDKVHHKLGMTEYEIKTNHDLQFQNGLFGVAMTLTHTLKMSQIYIERMVPLRIQYLNNHQCNICKLYSITILFLYFELGPKKTFNFLSIVHSRNYNKDC